MMLGASQMLPGQTLSIPKTLGLSSVAHDMGHQNTPPATSWLLLSFQGHQSFLILGKVI